MNLLKMPINLQKNLALIFLLIVINLNAFAATPIKVACIGNSVTYGSGLENPQLESYPAQLQKLLGSAYQVENFGRNGATLLKKGHNPYYKTAEFKKALAFDADIAIIHLGLNDTDPRNWPNFKDDFEADYAWLLDTLRKQNPAIKLYISRLTPIFSEHPRFKSGTRNWYWQIQQRISEIAKANNAQLIDLHTALYNRPDLFPDNLHPLKEGAQIIARTVYQNLSGNYGGLQLHQLFADHMVLQRKQPIPIYGKADAGEPIEVTFNNKHLSATTDANGQWKVVFPAMQHGGPYELLVKQKDKQIRLKNILIGDVWLCSGQSNMAFSLKSSENGMSAAAIANKYPNLRLLKLKALRETDATAWDSLSLAKTNQLAYFSGSWEESNKLSAADFSAIGFHFGKQINQAENIPIGLIQLAVGGSTLESWLDRSTMEHDDRLVAMLSNWRKSDFIMPWGRERADLNLKNAKVAKQRHPYEPTYNYEAGIRNLVESPINGVIWYQGESNTHHVEAYEHLFPTLVSSWRQKWGYDFPFYFVQLSSIDRPSWPSFRYAQYKLSKQIPKSGMAVSLDLGDSLDVHPKKKEEIGNRLAKLALRDTYHRSVVATGPEAVKAEKKGEQIVITFNGAKRLDTDNKKVLQGFSLVNVKGQIIPASGVIRDNKVHLTIPTAEQFKAVLYAWEPFTRANLVNEAGLPSSTFKLPLQYN
ncbi:GDSL-type esterase/lipase family protein [Pedobacter immunditicola]|uniref:GDSL-type esterase/lipase family protein n=1 Tax=Pedobacter immunditicola TaxID=3133440 RepID=UPI0030AB7FCA